MRAYPLRSRNIQSLRPAPFPFLQSSPGTRDHRSFPLRSSALVKLRGRRPTTLDIITRQFRDPVQYFKHSQDEVLQDFSPPGNNFICNLLRQRQNTLHTIAKARGGLVVLALFVQELNRRTLLLPPIMLVARTNLKRDTCNTEDSLHNSVQLTGVNVLLVLYGCGITDIREDSTIFDRLVHRIFRRYAHHWGVSLQQAFEFMERKA